ncbi:MAG: NTP transferase domain-containing protein [Fibrella sp.]|nr:NTP transferase domain-containing protein [Armatimonadota bacterium]
MIAALILAGGTLAPELVPFADGAANRALIRVGPDGETMLDLVVRAVKGGMRVHDGGTGRILVAGDVPTPQGCEAVDGGNSLVETLMNGTKALRADESSLLIVTADAPFLTEAAVADFLERAESVQPTPFAYPIIDAQKCLIAFPDMKRTTLRIAEGEFTGGNIALLDPVFLRDSERAIRDAYANRKNIPGLARMLGAGIIARLVFSRVMPSLLGIRHLEAAVGRLLHSSTPRAIVTAFPEIGADVDRPEDILIARRILAR